METLTMAQALRHMAERAEQGCETPWYDLEIKRGNDWCALSAYEPINSLGKQIIRLKPQPKIVNGTECFPHRGELERGRVYYVLNPMHSNGYQAITCTIYSIEHLENAQARGCVYTTAKGAWDEAKAQGWV